MTRVSLDSLPGSPRLHVAMLIWVPFDEFDQVHEVHVKLGHPETSTEVMHTSLGLQLNPGSDVEPGEGVTAPAVLDLSPVRLDHPGMYDLQVEVTSSGASYDLAFVVRQPPT